MSKKKQTSDKQKHGNDFIADVSGSGLFDRKPHCQCLYEIENNLPRTQFCFMACSDQYEILKQREKK